MVKIGDVNIEQKRATCSDGSEITLTKAYDSQGNEVDFTRHVRMKEVEVTQHGPDEVLVQRNDGSATLFKLEGNEFKYRESLRFSPSGMVESSSISADEIEQDKAFIESAMLIIEEAKDFKEVEDDLFGI